MILRPRVVGWTSALMTLALLGFGLWPFAFFPRNRAAWLADGPGLHFERESVAYSPGLSLIRPAAANSHEAVPITLAFWLRAESAALTDCFPVFTIDDGALPPNLVICQFHDKLLLRVPDAHAVRGFREVGIEGLERGRSRAAAVTLDGSGAAFYLDGRPAQRFPGFIVPSRTWRGRIVLGASSEGGPSWMGSVFGLAIFDRVLTEDELIAEAEPWTWEHVSRLTRRPGLLALFPLNEQRGAVAADLVNSSRHLVLPPVFRSPHFQWLRVADRPFGRSNLNDFLLNAGGFLPLGFVLFVYLRDRMRWSAALGLAAAAGMSVSLVIETSQAWLPGRDSSAHDLALNTVGTAAGALMAAASLAVRRPAAPS